MIFNYWPLHAFYECVKRSWFKALQRRSQKSRMNSQRFDQLLAVYPLLKPVIHQPWYSVAAGPQVTFQKSPVVTHDERFFAYLKEQLPQDNWIYKRIIQLDPKFRPRFHDHKIADELVESGQPA